MEIKKKFFLYSTLEAFDHQIDFDENYQYTSVNEHN